MNQPQNDPHALFLQRLHHLRESLCALNLEGMLVPVQDAFISEYPPAASRRLEWLTGFTGSAGLAVILKDKAALFTDGRYTLQAKAELPAAYHIFNSAECKPEAWLKAQSGAPLRLAYDPWLHTQKSLEQLSHGLKKTPVECVALSSNPIDALWQNRPAAPASIAQAHPLEISGQRAEEKIKIIISHLRETGADAALIATPESVNWLFNIRAADLEFTPLLLCRALVTAAGEATLYASDASIPQTLRQGCFTLKEPQAVVDDVEQLGRAKKTLLADPALTPAALLQSFTQAGGALLCGEDPCLLPKAIKNASELTAIAQAHTWDGMALVKLFHWLEQQSGITEIQVAEQLEAFRAEHEAFLMPSFATIAGSGPNGAIVHYRATEKTNRVLQPHELFLLDSGGQYAEGTTDVTRTLAIGEPTPEMKTRYTLVLKGHIAIAKAQFPAGTTGSQLDALARQFLWADGVDYDHGTGHGVGQCLSVHEGPQRISKRGGDVPLQAGMILSNEPGYYKTGAYGIRIENLVQVVEKNTCEGRRFLGFHTLTCAPLDVKLVEPSLMTTEETAWLNHYHAWVETTLSPMLETSIKEWLTHACQPLKA